MEEITPKFPINMGGDVGTNFVRIISHKEVDLSDAEVEKVAQLNKDELIERIKQLQIELEMQDGEK